jgi:hypothetical protein
MRFYPGLALTLSLGATALAFAQPPVANNQSAREVRRSALEVIPEALIGVWKLDPAASSYQTPAPQAQIRVFDYTRDGRLLCDYVTQLGNGKQTDGNWEVQLDGSPGIEYTRPYGSTPFAVVTLRKLSETALYLTAARFGKVFETGTFTISPDGGTLTFRYQQGARKDTAVYHRWNLSG